MASGKLTSAVTTGEEGRCCFVLSAVEPTLLRDWRLMTFGKDPHLDTKGTRSGECAILGILADLGFYLDPATKFMDLPRQGPARLTVCNVWSSSPSDAFQLVLTKPEALVLASSGLTKDADAMKEIVRSQTILPESSVYNPMLMSDQDQVSLARLYGLSYINWRSSRSVKRGTLKSPPSSRHGSRHDGEYRTIALYPPLSRDMRMGGTLINPETTSFSMDSCRGATDTLPMFNATLDRLERSAVTSVTVSRFRSVQSSVSRTDSTKRTCAECETAYFAPAFIANTCASPTLEERLLRTDKNPGVADQTCFDVAHTLTHIIDVLVSDGRSDPVVSLYGDGISRPGCRFLWVPPLNSTYAEMCAAALALGSLFGQDPVALSASVLSSRLPVSLYGGVSEGIVYPEETLRQRQYLPSVSIATLLEDAANFRERINSEISLLLQYMTHPAVRALSTTMSVSGLHPTCREIDF
nr:MAG: hypothetical protein [Marsupenaeus japonicus pemonivirus]